MGDYVKNFEDVYAKWENKPRSTHSEPGTSNGYNRVVNAGRQAWKEKFRDAAPPPDRHTRQKRKGRRENGSVNFLHSSTVDHTAFYKTTQTIQPEISSRRPFMGRCPRCLPESRMMFFEDNMRDQGFQDVLKVETSHMDQPWLTRRFSRVFFMWRRDVSHKHPDVSLSVLTSPRLIEAIQSKALSDVNAQSGEPDQKQLVRREKFHERYAKAVLKRMAACVSSRLLRFAAWFLHHFLGRLLTGILIHKGQLELLRRTRNRKVPVIYLPTHRSHLDYILITFILVNFEIQAPHVAAGDNLLIPFFSRLMRGLGGYFIRRRLDNGDGQKDLIYRATLHEYMDQLLQRGESFEFFLEGGRTRSGKALYPKGGLLSVVVDSFREGNIDDVCLVPVGISYEKIMDGNFVAEQMGGEKVNETFFRAAIAIWRVFLRGFGKVRVDFGQPFSLKEYLELSSVTDGVSQHESRWVQGVAAPLTPKLGSFSPLCSSDSLTDDYRYKIQGLAEFVVYGCQNCQAVMSTHLLAFLLLTRHREGAKLKVSAMTMKWLKDEVQSRGRDVGFCGEMEDVILYAAQLLGSHLVQVSELDDGESLITPTTALPDVFELSYYANSVSCTFALESVLAFSVVAETSSEDWLDAGQENQVLVSQSSVLQRAADLCHLLQYDFILKLPSTPWEDALKDGLESLITCEVISHEESYNHGKQFSSRVSNAMSWADDSDDSDEDFDTTKYVVNVDSSYGRDKLQFLLSVLSPLLECYHVVAGHVETLINNPLAEDVFVRSVHQAAKERVKSGISVYSESASFDSVRNAVDSLQQIGIIEKVEGVTTSNKKLLMLHDDDLTTQRLGLLSETLSHCVGLSNQCRFSTNG